MRTQSANNCSFPVDGGQWHTSGVQRGGPLSYPEFLMSGKAVTGVAGGKKSKL